MDHPTKKGDQESLDLREHVSDASLADYVPNSAAERALVRKMDLRIFPALWVMYLMNYLDRSNIGNARIAGMATDLKLTDDRYSVALLVFFVGYLLGEVPSNMVLSRSRPSLYLPAIMCAWGVAAALFSKISSYQGLVAARFCLGIIECGFFPGVLFFTSSWYRKAELAKRMAWFYSAAIMSGAFGGLLAGGITASLNGRLGIAAWRWLFIVEGCMTITVSIACIFILPDWPATTHWLTDAEKRLALQRIQADNIGSAGENELGHWGSLKAAVCDWRTWIFTFMYMMIVGAGTISYFIPTITVSLGFSGHKAQFMTVPVYATAFIFSILISTSADHLNERVMHTAIPSLAATFCFVIIAAILNPTARYVLLCFGAAGIWTTVPMVLAYLPNTITYPSEKRGISQAIANMIANLASIYGSFLWPSTTAPRYAMGWATTSAFCFACAASALAMGRLDKRYPYAFNAGGAGSNGVAAHQLRPADKLQAEKASREKE